MGRDEQSSCYRLQWNKVILQDGLKGGVGPKLQKLICSHFCHKSHDQFFKSRQDKITGPNRENTCDLTIFQQFSEFLYFPFSEFFILTRGAFLALGFFTDLCSGSCPQNKFSFGAKITSFMTTNYWNAVLRNSQSHHLVLQNCAHVTDCIKYIGDIDIYTLKVIFLLLFACC